MRFYIIVGGLDSYSNVCKISFFFLPLPLPFPYVLPLPLHPSPISFLYIFPHIFLLFPYLSPFPMFSPFPIPFPFPLTALTEQAVSFFLVMSWVWIPDLLTICKTVVLSYKSFSILPFLPFYLEFFFFW